MGQITIQQLKSLFPNNFFLKDLADVLNQLFPKYAITTLNRQAGFIAQCGVESSGFTVLKENLNYSAQGLLTVFPHYFPDVQTATLYAHQPELIANRIYANRLGNSDETSGDGYKYRGRGVIQLTGRANYQVFANSLGMDLDSTVSDLETLDGAIESACWFWRQRRINSACDNDDIYTMTKLVNGGVIALDQRMAKYQQAKGVLNV